MNAPNETGADRANDHPRQDHTSSNANIVADLPDDRKVFETLAARAATGGCALHQLSGGGYLLCRWGLSREVPDLRSVGALLSQIGVRA